MWDFFEDVDDDRSGLISQEELQWNSKKFYDYLNLKDLCSYPMMQKTLLNHPMMRDKKVTHHSKVISKSRSKNSHGNECQFDFDGFLRLIEWIKQRCVETVAEKRMAYGLDIIEARMEGGLLFRAKEVFQDLDSEKKRSITIDAFSKATPNPNPTNPTWRSITIDAFSKALGLLGFNLNRIEEKGLIHELEHSLGADCDKEIGIEELLIGLDRLTHREEYAEPSKSMHSSRRDSLGSMHSRISSDDMSRISYQTAPIYPTAKPRPGPGFGALLQTPEQSSLAKSGLILPRSASSLAKSGLILPRSASSLGVRSRPSRFNAIANNLHRGPKRGQNPGQRAQEKDGLKKSLESDDRSLQNSSGSDELSLQGPFSRAASTRERRPLTVHFLSKTIPSSRPVGARRSKMEGGFSGSTLLIPGNLPNHVRKELPLSHAYATPFQGLPRQEASSPKLKPSLNNTARKYTQILGLGSGSIDPPNGEHEISTMHDSIAEHMRRNPTKGQMLSGDMESSLSSPMVSRHPLNQATSEFIRTGAWRR